MTAYSSPAHQRALDFWFRRVNFELASPQPGELRLDRIRSLLERLGNPQQGLRILHIAGSKGKGSTAAILAAILRQAGYRTGLFTSPHLCRVEERIQIDGQPIAPDELVPLVDELRMAVSAGPAALEPTFFEIATALGFLHFARRRVDAAVIEVGLGGRFDSTNVCSPEVALITSISFDHTQQLGNRLASIAMEKAGIVKPGRPALSGATHPEARVVIERICRERGAPLRQLGVDFHYHYQPGVVGTGEPGRRSRVQVVSGGITWPEMELNLLGEHQAANAALAVACVEALRAGCWDLPTAAVRQGLGGVNWPARMEVVGRRPLAVLDCAHNVASARALVETLQSCFPPCRRLLVFAGSADKDLAGMFRVLAPHFERVFLTRYSSSSRSAPPEQLAELLQQAGGPPGLVCPTAAAAWQAAAAAARPEDLICATGSVFLAGELRSELAPDAGR
jgi:dihydrofolate synthase/folylpolyglutamate synthase